MSEPMPSIPTQSTFTYPNPNPSASPSFTQDDTSESFIPEPTQPMPTFTQTAFSQPASQQFQQFQTATISANNAKFPYLEKEKYEIWAMKMEYWIQNADHNLWRIVQQATCLHKGYDRFQKILSQLNQVQARPDNDDIIFGSTNKAWCEEFEVLMKGEFEMSAIGEMNFFLGLQVQQLPDGIFISQDKYVKDMLTKFDMESVRTATTPYEAAKTSSS
ncbi:uncharacterized mitochondrial protein-like protein [Tanacetum coccineum]